MCTALYYINLQVVIITSINRLHYCSKTITRLHYLLTQRMSLQNTLRSTGLILGSILVGIGLLLPGSVLAQSASIDAIQQEINAVSEKARDLSSQLNASASATGSANVQSNGRIFNIAPKRGPVGKRVQLKTNSEAVADGDWSLYFGKGNSPLPDSSVNVRSVGQPDINRARHTVTFRVPERLQKERPECEGTRSDPCSAQAYPYEPTRPGEYAVWIEDQNGRTNAVTFKVVQEPGGQPGADDRFTLTDSFKSFKFQANISHVRENVWRYNIKGSLPNPCYGFDVEYNAANETLMGLVSTPDEGQMCTSVVKQVVQNGSIKAPRDAEFSFKVGIDRPVKTTGPTPTTTTTDNETSKEDEGNKGDATSTQEEDNTSANDRSRDSIRRALNSVRMQIQTIMKRLGMISG